MLFFLHFILSFSFAIYSGPTKSISFPWGVTNASNWRGPSLSSLFSVGNDDQHSIDGSNSAWLYFIRLFVYRKCSNPVNYLKQQLLMTLQEVLLDDGRPFCSHYGAVVGLTELGPEVKSDCLHSQFCIFSYDYREWSPNFQKPHPFFMWRTSEVWRAHKLAIYRDGLDGGRLGTTENDLPPPPKI